VDDLHQRIQGADKKKMPTASTAMLPDKVGDFELSLVKPSSLRSD